MNETHTHTHTHTLKRMNGRAGKSWRGTGWGAVIGWLKSLKIRIENG